MIYNGIIAFITAQKMKFSIKDFFSKCDQIRSFLRIWLHLLKKSLIENLIFCAVYCQRSSKIITENYFCFRYENRQKNNQYFELPFGTINLHFGTLYWVSTYNKKINSRLIKSIDLVFYSLEIQERLVQTKV